MSSSEARKSCGYGMREKERFNKSRLCSLKAYKILTQMLQCKVLTVELRNGAIPSVIKQPTAVKESVLIWFLLRSHYSIVFHSFSMSCAITSYSSIHGRYSTAMEWIDDVAIFERNKITSVFLSYATPRLSFIYDLDEWNILLMIRVHFATNFTLSFSPDSLMNL